MGLWPVGTRGGWRWMGRIGIIEEVVDRGPGKKDLPNRGNQARGGDEKRLRVTTLLQTSKHTHAPIIIYAQFIHIFDYFIDKRAYFCYYWNDLFTQRSYSKNMR